MWGACTPIQHLVSINLHYAQTAFPRCSFIWSLNFGLRLFPPSLFLPAIILPREGLCPVPTVLKPCCDSESLGVFVKILGHSFCVSELGNLHFNQQAPSPTLGRSDLVRRRHFEQPCAIHLGGGLPGKESGVSFSSAHPAPAVPGLASNKSL